MYLSNKLNSQLQNNTYCTLPFSFRKEGAVLGTGYRWRSCRIHYPGGDICVRYRL